ncbi:tRNA-dihydrouridine(20/20a) synthase (U20-specific dihydrouridine synthase) (U20-specific Dus) (tRNA-dihydrouridine synthase A) [Durusdinium trenchii]|uniref:tRNA-dihydrouridine(20/20a) synthase (U20-specific dihydrouridine synthase) (U20-specific Dus) (tRNA-dihydrouridine synthase A) n=1 Tax=Durusdinium trenchii TaxID=1381693 RepID=A0ABP0HVZ8_9DINO
MAAGLCEDGDGNDAVKPVWNGFVAAGFVMVALGVLVCVGAMGVLVRFRRTPVIQVSQYSLLQAYCVGFLALNLSGVPRIINSFEPFTDALCVVQIWLIQPPLTFILAALTVKEYGTWRVRINTVKLRKYMLSEKLRVLYLSGCMAVIVLLMLIWTFVEPAEINPCQDYQCSTGDSVLFWLMGAFQVLQILLLLLLAWKNRRIGRVGGEGCAIVVNSAALVFLFAVFFVSNAYNAESEFSDTSKPSQANSIEAFAGYLACLAVTLLSLGTVVGAKLKYVNEPKDKILQLFLSSKEESRTSRLLGSLRKKKKTKSSTTHASLHETSSSPRSSTSASPELETPAKREPVICEVRAALRRDGHELRELVVVLNILSDSPTTSTSGRRKLHSAPKAARHAQSTTLPLSLRMLTSTCTAQTMRPAMMHSPSRSSARDSSTAFSKIAEMRAASFLLARRFGSQSSLAIGDSTTLSRSTPSLGLSPAGATAAADTTASARDSPIAASHLACPVTASAPTTTLLRRASPRRRPSPRNSPSLRTNARSLWLATSRCAITWRWVAAAMGVELSVAPMMAWTTRQQRWFMRLMARRAVLYTEMVVDSTVAHRLDDLDEFYGFEEVQHPVVLQLGGNSPERLAQATALAEQWRFDEVNLNCGCPSDVVAKNEFGASLMLKAANVREMVAAMRSQVSIPVTVKCRLGVDDHDDYDFVRSFVEELAPVCDHFLIHARKCLLGGLSPKQNRNIPPLQYDRVFRLCSEFPDKKFSLNGGLTSVDQIVDIVDRHPELHGIMIGRAAYHNPCMFIELEYRLFGETGCIGKTRPSAQLQMPSVRSRA